MATTVTETPELTEAELLAINVDAYKRQAAMPRMNVSDAIKSMMEFIEENQETDHFVNSHFPPEKENPWLEKKGCVVM